MESEKIQDVLLAEVFMLCLYPEPLTSVSFGLPASHSHSFSIPRRKTRLRLGYEVSALSDYQPLYLPDSLRRFGRAGHSLQTGATADHAGTFSKVYQSLGYLHLSPM